jgi:GntR family transcriptional regulator/MocR family aminotransferase
MNGQHSHFKDRNWQLRTGLAQCLEGAIGSEIDTLRQEDGSPPISARELSQSISKEHKLNLHKRLAECISDAIDSAALPEGSQLPSTRELAKSLGVARGTVSRAYAVLNRQGQIITRPGGKTYISKKTLEIPPINNLFVARVPNALRFSAYANRLPETSEIFGSAFRQAHAPSDLLPKATWKRTMSKLCDRLGEIDLENHFFGYLPLRTSLAHYLRRKKGITCSTDQVLTVFESQRALNHILEVFVQQGDLVVLEDPCSQRVRNLFLAHGVEVLPVPIDEQGLQVEVLKQHLHRPIKMVYVTPSFQMPTGICMSLPRRQELLELARSGNMIIVEDAQDSDCAYISPTPPPLQSLGSDENVVYLYSFCKTLYPLSTLACLVVPPQFVKIFQRAISISQGVNCSLEHCVLAEFIDQGELEKHVLRLTRRMMQRRQKLIQDLVSGLGRSVCIKRQSAAFWLTIELLVQTPSSNIFQAALETGLTIFPTDTFYSFPPQKKEFIVPFTGILSDVDFAGFARNCGL